MKTQLDIRVKNPQNLDNVLILPPGLDCTIKQNEAGQWRCIIPHNTRPEKPYSVRIQSAFKAPSIKVMEKWSDDGIAKSIGGKRVEPDGYDENGLPSWMLILGLI